MQTVMTDKTTLRIVAKKMENKADQKHLLEFIEEVSTTGWVMATLMDATKSDLQVLAKAIDAELESRTALMMPSHETAA